MLSVLIYVLTFVIIIIILMSAVIIHLQFGFHKQTKPKKKPGMSDEKNRQKLHEALFESSR